MIAVAERADTIKEVAMQSCPILELLLIFVRNSVRQMIASSEWLERQGLPTIFWRAPSLN